MCLHNTLQKSFRAVLFRMVPKPTCPHCLLCLGFRAVLFRMVPKLDQSLIFFDLCFRAVLFRMVPKRLSERYSSFDSFRAVLFRMVPKLIEISLPMQKCFRAVLFRMVSLFLCNDFWLTYLQTHPIIEESSIEMGEETCYTNIRRFFTRLRKVIKLVFLTLVVALGQILCLLP